jgi:NAD-dependent dihydropyrimidine dehydrogenase PreA subunit
MIKNHDPSGNAITLRISLWKGGSGDPMAFKVTVDKERCNGCEECLETCTVGIFRMQHDKAVPVMDRECLGCESCVGVCDENAITVTDTRVALSDTCLHLLQALDDMETEPESRRADGL